MTDQDDLPPDWKQDQAETSRLPRKAKADEATAFELQAARNEIEIADAAIDAALSREEALKARIAELEAALRRISDGYGPDHGSKFAYETARAALTPDRKAQT